MGILWTLGMSLGETYSKFSPRTTRNKLLKFQHYRHKKWNDYQNMLNLNMLLGELNRNEMRNLHRKFHEFDMHKQ
jgi:hypothetical protein